MTNFYFSTVILALVTVAVMTDAYRRTGDSLHPSVILGPMLLFLYVGMPANLWWNDGFFGFLTESQVSFAQVVNALGVAAFMLGLAAGARGGVFVPGWTAGVLNGRRLADAGVLIGSLGLLGYGAGVVGVGGFAEAYGHGYGGGWSDSGYVRELYLLTVPGILLLLVSGEARKRRFLWFWVAAFSAPLGIQGILGGRRGPTFVVVVTLLAGFFLIRGRRPALLKVLGTGAALGFLMLFLVANRDEIYLGSDFKLEGSAAGYLEAGASNEFVYGAGAVIAASETGSYYWGGRYATVLFIRPIPRAVWPTKYDFALEVFGADVERNMGVNIDAMTHVLGWVGALGAAPGIVADMFLEFSWLFAVVLAGLGFAYGRSWKLAVNRGGLWTVLYGILLSLSLYLVMQTLEAAIFRMLIMSASLWLASRYARPVAPVLSPVRSI